MQHAPELETRPYAPLAELLRDSLVKPKELAARWGMTVSHLSNLRRAGDGPSWIRLPSGKRKGAIRYRLSEIVESELTGAYGTVTLDRVRLAVLAAHWLPPEQRQLINDHIGRALRQV